MKSLIFFLNVRSKCVSNCFAIQGFPLVSTLKHRLHHRGEAFLRVKKKCLTHGNGIHYLFCILGSTRRGSIAQAESHPHSNEQ